MSGDPVTPNAPLTDTELDAIAARAGAATAGPWGARVMNDPQWFITVGDTFAFVANTLHGNDEANATFIAASRADVLALVEEVRRLREALDLIAHTGTDCPAGGDPASTYQSAAWSCIGTAARALRAARPEAP